MALTGYSALMSASSHTLEKFDLNYFVVLKSRNGTEAELRLIVKKFRTRVVLTIPSLRVSVALV